MRTNDAIIIVLKDEFPLNFNLAAVVSLATPLRALHIGRREEEEEEEEEVMVVVVEGEEQDWLRRSTRTGKGN